MQKTMTLTFERRPRAVEDASKRLQYGHRIEHSTPPSLSPPQQDSRAILSTSVVVVVRERGAPSFPPTPLSPFFSMTLEVGRGRASRPPKWRTRSVRARSGGDRALHATRSLKTTCQRRKIRRFSSKSTPPAACELCLDQRIGRRRSKGPKRQRRPDWRSPASSRLKGRPAAPLPISTSPKVTYLSARNTSLGLVVSAGLARSVPKGGGVKDDREARPEHDPPVNSKRIQP